MQQQALRGNIRLCVTWVTLLLIRPLLFWDDAWQRLVAASWFIFNQHRLCKFKRQHDYGRWSV